MIKAFLSKVININNHPRADTLSLYEVDVKGERKIFIQKRDYLKSNELVVIFLPDSTLPKGYETYDKYLIRRRVKAISIRGVTSYGVIEKYNKVFPLDPYELIDKEVYGLVNIDVSKLVNKTIVGIRDTEEFISDCIISKDRNNILSYYYGKYIKIGKSLYEIHRVFIDKKEERIELFPCRLF